MLLFACNALLGNEKDAFLADGSAGAADGTAGAGRESSHAGEGGETSTGGSGGGSSSGGTTGSGGAGGEDAQGGADSGGSPSGGTSGSGGASTGGAGGTAGSATGGSGMGGSRPDLPLDGMELWFKADEGAWAGGNGSVNRWVDQSPKGQDATQTDANLQPRLVMMPSGPPMVEFDGKGDALRLPNGFARFTGASFFVVAEAFENENCAGILSLSNGDDGDDIEFGRHRTNLLYYEVLNEFVEGTTGAFEVGRRLLGTIVQDGTGRVELRLNGAITGTPKKISLPTATTRTQNFVGKNTYDECPTSFGGRIGELILYSRGLSTAEQERVEAYLEDKWDI